MNQDQQALSSTPITTSQIPAASAGLNSNDKNSLLSNTALMATAAITLVVVGIATGYFWGKSQSSITQPVNILPTNTPSIQEPTVIPTVNLSPNQMPTVTISPIPQISTIDKIMKDFPVAYKPVIYLYPENILDVNVRLLLDGEITHSYPLYNSDKRGWSVKAFPDGKIINSEDEREYSYLFWEGKLSNQNIDTSEGFVVEGKDTQNFLQDKLSEFGLSPKEYNEFIVYWLPILEQNKYNYIKFLGSEYTDQARLIIDPKPDTILRVFMAYRPLNKIIDVKKQKITSLQRVGFTVVEWGGMEISSDISYVK